MMDYVPSQSKYFLSVKIVSMICFGFFNEQLMHCSPKNVLHRKQSLCFKLYRHLELDVSMLLPLEMPPSRLLFVRVERRSSQLPTTVSVSYYVSEQPSGNVKSEEIRAAKDGADRYSVTCE